MTNFLKFVQQFANRPLIAYGALLLLQLKVVWRMWDYKDLTFGDTSSYFLDAYRWFEDFSVHFIWSPLYTSFYGSFLHITTDVYAATILHRLVIVFAATALVLALARKLLPAGIAWLIGAWWAILPINFNTLYEVHLFAVIPVLIAGLLILSSPLPWARGAALGVMLATSLLVRNELSLATMGLACICLVWEIWQYRSTVEKPAWRTYILSYGIPLLIATSIILFFYSHSHTKYPELSIAAVPKHTLNICQVYAFGYQQRYTDWTGSPWTECQSLMQRQFGQDQPSLFQALQANPAAMIEHFLWNFSLALNGLQVALFNGTSGSVNPDYAPVNLNQRWVILPTLAVGATLITGLMLLYRNRDYWWRFWLKERALGWLLLLPIAALCILIIFPMQRPRPSYFFSLTFLLMALVGMSIFVITHRWRNANKLSIFLPFIMLALLIWVPNYYPNIATDRRLLHFYRQFTPFQDVIARADTVFLVREYSFELCSYLRKAESCQPLSYAGGTFFANMSAGLPLEAYLEQQKVNLFYVDENLLAELKANPQATQLLTKPLSVGWKLIAAQNLPGSTWKLFQKMNQN